MSLARSYRGLILVSAFLVVDCILIWIVNSNTSAAGIPGPISAEDGTTITLVLVGAAILAALAAVLWKLKPWK